MCEEVEIQGEALISGTEMGLMGVESSHHVALPPPFPRGLATVPLSPGSVGAGNSQSGVASG